MRFDARIMMRLFAPVGAAALLSTGLSGCADTDVPAGTDQTGTATEAAKVYVADMKALNEDVTGPITGTARVTVDGDEVVFEVNAKGVPANIMHLQHTHGLTNGGTSACPGDGADANNDGVIDLVEAEESTGTTMIPFHDNPASMEIKTQTYPTADANGNYTYRDTENLAELRQAFQRKFPNEEFRWDQRVVMIHGVPEDAAVPSTARSLPGVPAHMTLPIACGRLQSVAD